MLNNGARDGKAFRFTVNVIMGVALFYVAAFFTNEKLGQVTVRPVAVIMSVIVKMVMVAGDKSVQRLDAVNEAVAREKLQRAVNRRRFRAANIGPETVQKIIGFDRLPVIYNQFKYMRT